MKAPLSPQAPGLTPGRPRNRLSTARRPHGFPARARAVMATLIVAGLAGRPLHAAPSRPETGLPSAPEAIAAAPPPPTEGPGTLQGDLGPLRMGLLGDLFATYRLVGRQDLLFHEFELSRIQAVQGAEVILRPSALLRSADIWELTSRARAYDNHVFVVGSNAVGADPAGVLYFGNSHIVTPIGHIVAKAATHEGWVSARLDPEEALASLTPGSNIGQAFDHLRDRNLDLIRNHRADLEAPASTGFPHKHHSFTTADGFHGR